MRHVKLLAAIADWLRRIALGEPPGSSTPPLPLSLPKLRGVKHMCEPNNPPKVCPGKQAQRAVRVQL